MIKSNSFILLLLFLFACQPKEKYSLNEEILTSRGSKHKTEFAKAAKASEAKIAKDSTDVDAYLGLAESNIYLYIFGFTPREEVIPAAKMAFQKARDLDSLHVSIQRLSGMLSFLDWDWNNSKDAFLKAIHLNPRDLSARHWYSLWLSAMGKFDEAMAQSDTISTMDPNGDYQLGRGSLMYFARSFEEMKVLMRNVVAKDTTVGWGYDWLGMAYIQLKEYDNSLKTYFRAFELSDGTVEVGAGLGHALGQAGEYDLAKQMADYYEAAAKDHYLPQVQRAFVHIGIKEYDKAIELLEEAYNAHSWFLIFMQVEPWLDPLRKDERFNDIMRRMKFPDL